MDHYRAYSHAHAAGPSSSSPYYRTSAAHASVSTDRLQMGIDTMNDDGGGIHIGSDAASVYPLTTDFSLGSSTSYGRYDHQAPIRNATVTGLRVQSPSRAMLSSMAPMVAPSRNPFASSEWSSGLVFNYGLDVAPHFDPPVASTSRSANSYSLKSWPVSQYSEQSTTSALLTHAVQSNMAILPQYQAPPAPIVQPEVLVDTVPTNEGPKLPEIYATIPLPPTNEQTASDRKKDGRKHACHMCHKSFDRPCTLRKHMLVHTGQKAYQCENCQRRFSVQSNLNRHRKRCGQPRSRLSPHQDSPRLPSEEEEVDAEGSPDPHPPAPSAPTNTAEEAANTPSFSISSHLPVEVPRRGGRVNTRRPAISTSDNPTSAEIAVVVVNTSSTGRGQKRRLETYDVPASASDPTTPPISQAEVRIDSPRPTFVPRRPRKRARRAPSPSRWIPDSLKLFDLTRIDKSTPKPLPPVQPYQDPQTGVHEERDSFDDNAPTRPYHPIDWKGKLPGPGLMKDETMKMGGTLLVF